MPSTTKLTKRQKKGLAFREGKHGKRKDKPLGNLDDEIDDASLEDQVLVDAPQDQQGSQAGAKALVGGAKGDETKAGRMVVADNKGKRKVDQEEEGTLGESDQPKSKRRRGSDGRPLDRVERLVDRVGAPEGEEGEKTKQRFILFLGNLKYTTTLETIQSHFSICIPPPTVRLLTPKPSTKSPAKSVLKSKGCAFLEFTHRGALQQGLKLHHSQLDGRQINVELTAGGGGKSVTRTKKLKERNKELEEQRRKQKDHKVDAQGKQRFSATSGTEQDHAYEHMGTTGDVEEKDTHRDGQKRQRGPKKKVSLAKDFRTGVNAIPIG